MKGGKLRTIVSWGEDRHPNYPDVPTFKELGYKDVVYYIWAGLVGLLVALRRRSAALSAG